jgi:hypothetical protein
MKHFVYSYCHETQALVQSDSTGNEIRRIFIPFCDMIKVAQVMWHESLDKRNLERE